MQAEYTERDDLAEGKLVLLFTFGVFGPSLWLLAGSNAEALAAASPYFRILPLLFLVQAVCEYGDAHAEHLKFFRHRYGFEAFTLAVLTCLPGGITPLEVWVSRSVINPFVVFIRLRE